MLTGTDHERNVNQNHNEISPDRNRDDCYKQNKNNNNNKNVQKRASIGTDANLEYFCTVGGNVKWCSCYGKQYGISSKN